MRIRQLTAFHVRLPLKRPFSHASAVRHDSDNILIRCTLTDGTSGWGEGVPRDYVTGESPDGCLQQLAQTPLPVQLGEDCQSWTDVVHMCDAFRLTPLGEDPRGCYGNALRAAVELSILDAFGRLFADPLSIVAQVFEPARPICATQTDVRYSTVVGARPGQRLRWTALKMRLYGFRHCKVKVGADGCDDPWRLGIIRRWIGKQVDIRVDANEAWTAAAAAAKIEPLMAAGITSVEQPCPHLELPHLAKLRRQVSIPIMLDESLTSLSDAEQAIQLEACDLFNLRLSKCGGMLACLRLAALAHQHGLGYQLGCHPGESGILSAAGRHWATSVGNYRYLEGSYDRHLLRRQLTREDMTFGYGGRAPALHEPGLGVTIDEQALVDLTRREETFAV